MTDPRIARRQLVERHTREIDNAIEAHRVRMQTMMDRQRLELAELMLEEDPRIKPLDVIAKMKASLEQCQLGEFPGTADYDDAACLIRMLDRLAAEKFTTHD